MRVFLSVLALPAVLNALQLPPAASGWTNLRQARTHGGQCGMMSVAMASTSSSAPGGSRGNRDAAELRDDPVEFCAVRMRQHGDIFVTGVSADSVFVGDARAVYALTDTRAASVAVAADDSAQLGAPFAFASAEARGGNEKEDPFAPFSDAFNAVCYEEMMKWIPRYKEAGFSTFRFEDFIDGRVRRLLPSVRSLVLRAAAPVLFGAASLDEVAPLLGFDKAADMDKAYLAHAVARRPAKLTIGMPSLFDLDGGGGDPDALRTGLQQWARSGKAGGLLGAAVAAGASDGAALLAELTSSVETTAAVACNMFAAAHLYPSATASLAAEQGEALAGMAPDAPIDASVLARMPQLDAFALETLRLFPPSRPCRLKLVERAGVPVSAVDDGKEVELSAGSTVTLEPFVAHMSTAAYASPRSFDPSRFASGGGGASSADAARLLIPFGCQSASSAVYYSGDSVSEGAPAGARLAVSMAKAIYVQARRMFEETVIGASPPCEPFGHAGVHTIGDKVEVLVKPRMYYELQRGVKKLRF